MKPFLDFHLHSTGSDGKFTPRQVIDGAIKKGLKFICFTDHYPTPPDKRDWGQNYNLDSYYGEVHKLKKQYKNIQIFYGAEFDWFDDSDYIKEEVKKRDYDYVLGSVHLIKADCVVDFSLEEIKEIAKKFGSMKKLILDYYRQIRLMVKSKAIDTVAHFDLIKKFNKDSCLFSEKESWYREEIFKTLDTIKQCGVCMEVNTSGLRHPVDEQHPSTWILREIKIRNIPITIGSDSHGKLFQKLDQAYEIVKAVGFKSIVRFDNRKMIRMNLD